MKKAETALRRDIIERCREMNAKGLNQGTSGNISVRFEDRMLISPSAIPYDEMRPEMIASLPLDGDGEWDGPKRPSTEWRFHHALLRDRPEIQAVVHAHPTYCTALAIARKDIPACHYMIAAFGGNRVRCAGYATFGTEKLSRLAIGAMKDRMACLLANHGMIAAGETLAKAMWRAVELETIARQYCVSLQIGKPVILSKAAIEETLAGFSTYGLEAKNGKAPAGNGSARKAATKKPAAKKAAARKRPVEAAAKRPGTRTAARGAR